jgi:hypothetical protein
MVDPAASKNLERKVVPNRILTSFDGFPQEAGFFSQGAQIF